MSRNSNRWFMDSPGVKYSGGKLVPHSDLRAGTASGGSMNRIKKDLRIGTWNVRTLYQTGALQVAVRETEKYELDILAIQEVRWENQDSIRQGKYTFYYGGTQSHDFGTGFLIKNSILQAVQNIEFVNERLSYVTIRTRWGNTVLLNVYAPTEVATDNDKDIFYDELERLFDRLPKYNSKIVLGDFNAKVGREEKYRPTIGKYSLHEKTNNNGERLITFAISKNLLVKSTYFEHKDIHKYTWVSPDGKTLNQIDHVLVDRRRHTNIMDVRSYRGAEGDTDHQLVITKVREKLCIANRENKGSKQLKFEV